MNIKIGELGYHSLRPYLPGIAEPGERLSQLVAGVINKVTQYVNLTARDISADFNGGYHLQAGESFSRF